MKWLRCRIQPYGLRVLGSIVNVIADEKVLDENGKIDVCKIHAFAFDQMRNGYYAIGEMVGQAWNAGADLSKVWRSPSEEYDTGEMDVSIVATHMMLEAWKQGIGTVWVRGFDSNQVAEVFELPENIKPICMMPIGYPSGESTPYEVWHSSYRSLSETVKEL